MILAVPAPLLLVLVLVLHSLAGALGGGRGDSFGSLLGRGVDGLNPFGSSGSGSGTSGGGFPGYGGAYDTANAVPQYPDQAPASPSDVPDEPTVPDSVFDSPTDTDSASASGSDPATVVEDYFTAINGHDYRTAWNLGGMNLGESYDSFVNGFSNTAQDQVTIESVNGDVVTASLLATNDDQSTQSFSGTYTVTGGVITQFAVQQTG